MLHSEGDASPDAGSSLKIGGGHALSWDPLTRKVLFPQGRDGHIRQSGDREHLAYAIR